MKRKTIRVPLESLLYLHEIMRNQRIGDHLSERSIERLTKNYNNHYKENGYELMDGSLGGAIGKPENSYEEHRWTDWNVQDMKEMLDKANLPYVDGEDIDVIDVYF